MGYYGRSALRGDYYRGDYYRGDFLDDVGSLFGTVGGYVDKGLKALPAIGTIVNAADRAFNFTSPAQSFRPMPSLSPFVGVNGGPANPPPHNGVVQGRRVKMAHEGGHRRRMNVCNPKALNRALRRTSGFMHFAKKYVRLVSPHKHVEMKAHPTHHKHKRKG